MSGISKLSIKAYSDDSFSMQKGEFSASINPKNLKISSSIDYATSQGMGSPSMALRYNVSPPRILTFKLLFDNTGIIPNADADVKTQLESLKNIIYDFQEDINSPYYVRVTWGIIDFKGKLVNLETSYTMFQSDGAPIRAEVDMVIIEEITPPTSIAQVMNSQSNALSNTPTSNAGSSGMMSGAASGALAGTAGGALAGTAGGALAGTAGGALAGTAGGALAGSALTNKTGGEASGMPGEAGNGEAGEDGVDRPGGEEGAAVNNDDHTPAEGSSDEAVENGNEGSSIPAGSGLRETKAGDSLPGIAKDSLGDPNLAKKLGNLNGLDSLRDLDNGLKLAVPFSLGALLAGLLAMATKYGKEGWNYLKKKAKEGEKKAIKLKNEGEKHV